MSLTLADDSGRFVEGTREAGDILQRLRNYGVRLAVVCAPGSVPLRSRFAELLAEERRSRWFGEFDSRHAAIDWLRR